MDFNYNYLDMECISQHEMIAKLLDPVVLEVNLRIRWEVTMGDREINNK